VTGMGHASARLRKVEGGYVHWCPACEKLHLIRTEGPVTWDFDGDLEAPTFSPSVKITFGGYAGDPVCHYFIERGQIRFCPDSTHLKAGQTVPMPDLPDYLKG